MTQNFSPVAYRDADEQLQNFFYTERVTLSAYVSNFNEYNIVKTSISYHYNSVYNDQLTTDVGLSTTNLVTYDMETSSSSTLPFTDFVSYGVKWADSTEDRLKRLAYGAQPGSPLVYMFTQSQQAVSKKYTRLALYNVMQSFGSYLAFIIRFSMLMLAGW